MFAPGAAAFLPPFSFCCFGQATDTARKADIHNCRFIACNILELDEQYAFKTFTSFSHTMVAIVNALSAARMHIARLQDFDYDVGLSQVYGGKGFPLSYILLAEKL